MTAIRITKHTPLTGIGLMILCTFFTSFGQLFFKMGLNRLEFSLLGLITNYVLILGFLFYGVGGTLLIVALKFGELSILYPILALGFVWVNLLSLSILNEQISLIKWMGIIFILFGVSMIGRGSNGN